MPSLMLQRYAVVSGRASIPVPDVVAYEADEQWLGAAFLVMSHASGRPGAEAPALDPWVTDAAADMSRKRHA